MMCIFPDPYPDELLSSICARYSSLMNYPNSVTATRDFFGDGDIAAVVSMPNRLDHLVAELPLGHLYSVNEIIYQHTHYPYYAPFLPLDRAILVRNTMRANSNNRVAERIGLSASRLKRPTHLRFCPSCVEQDREYFGETYWHRIHQIPGVEVCPHHAVYLEDSKSLWRNSSNPSEAFPAESSVYDTTVRAIDISNHSQSIRLNISRQALWLLEWSGDLVGSEILRRHYHNLLVKQGLACYSGQIRTAQLIQKFLEYYPSELLIRLGCEISNPHSNWLLRLLQTHKVKVAQHPIRHILFLNLISSSPADVLDTFIEFKPFGDGPWPCLNHASGHYAESRVLSCHINEGVKKNKRKVVGAFSCSCGFIYTRIGPDKEGRDRFKLTSIQSYGKEWEKQLKRFWGDTSLTLRQVAHKLGANELTVKRRAINLGLTFPRLTPGSLRASGEILNRYTIKLKPIQEKQNINRKSLSLLIDDNPQASRTELQVLAPHLIDWLRRWDGDWLEKALPPAKKRQPPAATVNWGKEDSTLSKAVEKAALDIRSIMDSPKRVSITAIINLVGRRAWIEKKLSKMPLTSKSLDAVLESFEDYLIRRIAWTVENFAKEGVLPSHAMLSNRSGVKGRIASNCERVQSALELALT